MALTKDKVAQDCKLLAGGKWIASAASEFQDVRNPSTGEVIARVPMGGAADVETAVRAAREAFPAWNETPVVERARIMFKFKALIEEKYDEIALAISREHGKTTAEAKASVQRGVEVVEFACSIPSLIMGESLENIARNVDCETIRHPLGVVAGITPFNFPAMVPLWMYPIAITCGNTFVLKPSEKVPMSAIIIAELAKEAGLPDGVLNIVHGGKECVDAILTHPDIKAVSFVGSTPVARYIYETATKNGKRVQSAGGAKNHIIIMPDADIKHTVEALKASAFGCAGERCMAGSVALPVGKAADELIPQLVESTREMKVGRTDGGCAQDMGPLISADHLKRVKGLIDKGQAEGADLVLDGRDLKVSDAPEGYFLGPTIFDKVKPDMSIYSEEVFGPVLSTVRVETIEEAIELGKSCPFGNGAVIFTSSGRAAREFKRHFNAGMIGINVGVPAPMAWFSFSGWNNSFFGDLHIQGRESIQFYTQQKMTMTRWFASSDKQFHDPIWKARK